MPERGDASACLKVTHPGGPARPQAKTIKERARHRAREIRQISLHPCG